MRALVGRLSGAQSSWGDVTLGEIRTTWRRPSKSAVLGLAAAALGVGRVEEDVHVALHRELGFAVRVDVEGDVLRDFQSVQVPIIDAGKPYRSREWMLGNLKTKTKLSYRDFMVGASAVFVLWEREPGDVLDRLVEAMACPKYALYLGRRGNVLDRPIGAKLFEAADAGEALRLYDESMVEAARLIGLPEPGPYLWSDTDGSFSGWRRIEETSRRDHLISRKAWLYNDRREVRWHRGNA